MTIKEASTLELKDLVYWDKDLNDWGVVVARSWDCITIHWMNTGCPCDKHRIAYAIRRPEGPVSSVFAFSMSLWENINKREVKGI